MESEGDTGMNGDSDIQFDNIWLMFWVDKIKNKLLKKTPKMLKPLAIWAQAWESVVCVKLGYEHNQS